MHVPDYALRQFRMTQHIPNPLPRLARTDRNQKHLRDWRQEHNTYILQWVDQANQI